jgi:hypothetical protein
VCFVSRWIPRSDAAGRKMIWADRFALGLWVILTPFAFFGLADPIGAIKLAGLGAGVIWVLCRLLDLIATGQLRLAPECGLSGEGAVAGAGRQRTAAGEDWSREGACCPRCGYSQAAPDHRARKQIAAE